MLNCRNYQGKWLNMTLFLCLSEPSIKENLNKLSKNYYAICFKRIESSRFFYCPGPSMYLADMGAEVIHVESPTRPDLVRIMPPYANGQATAHSYLNRNKQSISLI
jgi:hypothetical protein